MFEESGVRDVSMAQGYCGVRDIPLWEKYTLTISEAAVYFRIGENKIRKLVSENKYADYVLWNGNRAQIKRKKFEKYVDGIETI